MDSTVTEQLVKSIFRFRKVAMIFHVGLDLNMGEIAVMKGIAEKAAGNSSSMCVSDIQNKLHITKPAVSQIYGSLEKKGYIIREIDSADRRKINVTLTAKGRDILDEMVKRAGKFLNEVVSRLGETDTKHLIDLFNRFADISDEIRRESTQETNQNGN